MKHLLLTLFSLLTGNILAQNELKDIDTTLDYRERFYVNGKLKVNPIKDYTDYVRDGKTINYVNKYWQISDSSDFRYYWLVERRNGFEVGKVYYFDSKNRLNTVTQRHPIITYLKYTGVFEGKPCAVTIRDTFDGIRRTSYNKKGAITEIEYCKSGNLDDSCFYSNIQSYHSNGKLKNYNLQDDCETVSHSSSFSSNGKKSKIIHADSRVKFVYRRKRSGKEFLEIK